MTTTNTPTARTTRTSFFDTTTNLWSDAFLAGRRGYFKTTTTKTTTMTTVNENNDKDTDGDDNDYLIF